MLFYFHGVFSSIENTITKQADKHILKPTSKAVFILMVEFGYKYNEYLMDVWN